MSEWNKLYSAFQEDNPEKFNEDIINLKEKDNILEKIEDACHSLEIIDGVHFKNARILSDRVIYEPKELKDKDDYYEVDYEESRVINIEINFTLKKKNEKGIEEKEDISTVLSFPRLLDGCYYLIKNVRYYPIYQIIDAETYKAGQSIIMRTSLQPIVLTKKNISIKPENSEDEIKGYYLFSKMFKIKVPILVYYFAKFGISNTLKFFNIEDIEIIEKSEVTDFDDYEGYYLFKFGKLLYVKVPTEFLDEGDIFNKIFLLSFISSINKNDKLTYEKIDSITYWCKKLGSYFTKNSSNFSCKGISVMSSFERLLDNTTKRLIRINDTDKKDIFTLVRWFIINYNSLLFQNNDDLANKRLRLNESFIYPLLEVWTQGVVRILNGKNITIKKLKTLFSINKNFLVNKACLADNMRYLNNVNTIDIGNKLKITIAGNQSISNAKGEIKGKNLHPSMLGRIDLVHTSNNDPGTTRMLTPFCEVTDTWHFTEMPNINVVGYEGEDIDFEENIELEEYLDDSYEYNEDEMIIE